MARRIIIFRTEADRQYYCDEKLTRIFGDSTRLDAYDETCTRMALKAVGMLALAFSAWAFATAARADASLDCKKEADRLEIIAKGRDAGLDQRLAVINLNASKSRVFGAKHVATVYHARSSTPLQLWYWAHGYCSSVRDVADALEKLLPEERS